MAATLVLTGATGPGRAVTAVTFTRVLWFRVDATKSLISFQREGETQILDVTLDAATTITATKSGVTWFLSIS